MNEGESTVASGVPASGAAALPTPKQEVDQKLQQAQEQLLKLRRLQEELERQKGDLEEMRRKQDEYSRGRTQALEDLTRGMVLLEREQVQAQRLGELCLKTRQSFAEYLEQIQGIRDQDWTSSNLRSELTRALGIIENARLEFNRACSRLDCLNPAKQAGALADDNKPTSREEFQRFVRLGLAASLPLMVAGTVWLVLLLLLLRK